MRSDVFALFDVGNERRVYQFNQEFWDDHSQVVLRMPDACVKWHWEGDKEKSEVGWVSVLDQKRKFRFAGSMLLRCDEVSDMTVFQRHGYENFIVMDGVHFGQFMETQMDKDLCVHFWKHKRRNKLIILM